MPKAPRMRLYQVNVMAGNLDDLKLVLSNGQEAAIVKLGPLFPILVRNEKTGKFERAER